jgi:hypothetical protein
MPDDLRSELEASARKRGRNLTDELLGRLRSSFAREHEQKRDPATRALNYLISKVAELTHLGLPVKWHQDPFMFRAFKLAVGALLDALEPSGEMRTPYEVLRQNPQVEQWFIDQYKTPETAALSVADLVLKLFSRPELGRQLIDEYPEDPNFERDEYQMSNARHALQPAPKKRGD